MSEEPSKVDLVETRPVCFHVEVRVGDGTSFEFEVPRGDPQFDAVSQAVEERGEWAGCGVDCGTKDENHMFDVTVVLRNPTVEIVAYHDGGAAYYDELRARPDGGKAGGA